MIKYRLRSGIAQLAERLSVKEDVVGPSPTPGASCYLLCKLFELQEAY